MSKTKKIKAIEEKQEEYTIKDEKSRVRTKEETMQAIKDSKVLYLSLSGGWGQTRHYIGNGKKQGKEDR